MVKTETTLRVGRVRGADIEENGLSESGCESIVLDQGRGTDGRAEWLRLSRQTKTKRVYRTIE